MSLHDPVFLEFDGTPVTGRTPVRVVVEDGTPTSRQMAEVEAQYADFCIDKRLSKATYHDVERVLSDGSRIRMNSIGGVDTVYIRAAEPDELEPFGYVAYTVTTDLEWAPIFDRIVLGGNGGGGVQPPGDPEPIYPVPPPDRDDFPHGAPLSKIRFTVVVQTPPAEGGISATFTTMATPGGGGNGTITYVPYLPEYGPGSYQIYSNVPAIAFPPPGLSEEFTTFGPWNREGTTDRYWTGDMYPMTVGNLAGRYISTMLDGEVGNVPTDGGYIGVLVEDNSIADEAIAYDAVSSAVEQAGDEAYEAALAAWSVGWTIWYNSKWKPWRDRVISGVVTTPSTKPLVNLRRAGRHYQLAALREYLDVGVSQPHLAARYLSFPFNITSKPNGELSPAPDNAVTASEPGPSDSQDRHVTYTLTNAVRESVVTENIVEPWDIIPFSRDGVYRLGTDMADPENLFGWQANGTFTRQAKYRAYHATERAYVDPRDLSTLSFSTRSGYKSLLEKGVVLSPETTLTISTDGYVPAGTTITLVQLEYEVFDPYTEQWIWTPHVGITQFDSIWIKSPGEYIVEPLPATDSEGDSPRNIRFRRVLRQQRNVDQSWTVNKEVSKDSLDDKGVWERPLAAAWGWMPPDKRYLEYHPTGIAIVEGLSPAAVPRIGTTVFPQNGLALWPSHPDLAQIVAITWAESTNLYKLCAEALRITKKLRVEA